MSWSRISREELVKEFKGTLCPTMSFHGAGIVPCMEITCAMWDETRQCCGVRY